MTITATNVLVNKKRPRQSSHERLFEYRLLSENLPPRPRRNWATSVLAWSCIVYAVIVTAAAILLHSAGDSWPAVTLALFGPRWLLAIPLALLVPLAALRRPRFVLLLTAAAAVLAWPWMGLCLPVRAAWADGDPAFRILTFRISSSGYSADSLRQLIAESQADIVALQGAADPDISWPANWSVARNGSLLVASPYVIEDVEPYRPTATPSGKPVAEGLRCIVHAPSGPLPFVNLLLPKAEPTFELLGNSLSSAFKSLADVSADSDRRSRASQTLRLWIEGSARDGIVAGALGMPAESAIYRRDWSGYANAFSNAGTGFGFTDWADTGKTFWGLRSDHILLNDHWAARRCWVGPGIGSDHRPLVAELVRLAR